MNRDLPRWPRIAVTAAAVVGLGVGVAGTAVVVGLSDGDQGPRIDPSDITLVSYDSCQSALRELKSAALPRVGPYGLVGDNAETTQDGGAIADAEEGAAEPVPAPGGPVSGADARQAAPADAGTAQDQPNKSSPEHSSTNVHESGVDEPDIVKTDGRRVVSIVDGQLRVVDVASRKQTATLRLPSGRATQLLIDGDRALVTTGADIPIAEPMPRSGGVVPDRPGQGGTPPIDGPPQFASQLVLVDLSGSGTVLGTLAVDGDYVDARQVGSVARVVVRSGPRLGFVYPVGVPPEEATAKNRAILEQSSISDWLPRYQLESGGQQSSGELVECTAVSHPKRYTGSAMLTVLTLDLQRELGTGDPISIAADGNTVYGTGTNLYIADDHFAHDVAGFGPADRSMPEGSQTTEIYQFDISAPGRPVHVASGGIEGNLLNQYSLSEHEGNLRVATTIGVTPQSNSMVSVLTRRGDELARVGKVGGLGKGERIYAVRFLGTTGYVVTFRETDPLYTVDLSDPAKPRATGELKITGYSAYLHPVGEDRLLGIGQEATTEGITTGTQVSLFDTSNPAGAKRIGQFHYAGGHSEVEIDPHAFLYWPDKDLVVMPVAGGVVDSSGRYDDGGALVLRLSGNSVSELGMVSHERAQPGVSSLPRRALVIGNELWTVSDTGMLVSDVDRLTQLAWVPFS